MNNKILIGSIIAVAILIGVSFTSVVGYRSGASDVKASPLFNIRTSRAIDDKSEELSCEYVGKGEDIDLYFPERIVTKLRIGSLIKRLNLMNEKEIESLVNYLRKQIDNKNMLYKNNLFGEIRKINELKSPLNFTLDDSFTCQIFPPACFLMWILECIVAIGSTAFIVFGLVTIPLFFIIASILGSIAGFLYFFLTAVWDDCEFSFGAFTACVCD